MRNKMTCLLPIFLLSAYQVMAFAPGTTTKHIKIDQFGYLPLSKKFAVIADPQTGFNAAESFSPGTGVNQYQVRRWTDDVVVLSGTLTAWNSGATHGQSGDRGWWFDFSAVNSSGSYYIYDVANNVGSYRFEVSNNVYNEVLKQAARMYFYQRINFAKQTPYVEAKWSDGAAFGGANQDYAARSRWDKANAATARDLHGGWMDAGDANKYTSFALGPLCNLLETYRMHPAVFTDNYSIPESGNAVADILDEIKWEIDWLTRMQDATGTNGLFLKVGADNYNGSSPPSTDNNPRYYVPECTSATLTGATVFALASIVYKSLGIAAMTSYGNNLQTRAINAWNRAKITTSNFTVFETACDDQNIVAGDADQDAAAQREMVISAAVYLFEATGLAEYKNTFDAFYTQARPYSGWWWGPYFSTVQKALLRYANLPSATVSVANNIKNVKAGQNYVCSIDDFNANTDLYRSFMPDAQYHWNSHEVKANAGLDNFDFVTFNVNAAQANLYKEVGENYLHWFHGVNPMGKVMLSNMYDYGGEVCVDEFYHGWFGDGTPWDNVVSSLYGPPPGYVPGGPNKDFSIPAMSPPGGQPPQKSYKEWNTGWNGSANENSWEITEAGIYTQAAYISLLVRTIANSSSVPLPLHVLSVSAIRNADGAVIKWETDGSAESREFVLQRSFDGSRFSNLQAVSAEPLKKQYSYNDYSAAVKQAAVYYRIKETDLQGRVYYSSIVMLGIKQLSNTISVYPNPAKNSLTVSGYHSSAEQSVFRIFDASGKVVLSEKWTLPAGNYSRLVNVEKLSSGTYWLQFSDREGQEPVRFFKQ